MIKLESGNYYTVDECSQKLGVTKQQIAKQCRLNKLESIRLESGINAKYYILESSLNLYKPNKRTGIKYNSEKERFKDWYEKNKETYNLNRRERAKLKKSRELDSST